MSKVVIKVEELSKQYRLGKIGTGTLSHDINRWWYRVRGKEDPYLKIGESNDRESKGESQYVWSLKDINFEIKQGEAVGIIGRNGAGKSTLLKILSRTTAPTTGNVKIRGRVASLLEVGTGFHPELSGRENIYLNGAILGMTRAEIKKKFDEIVDFAGVARYVDTPVKRYSSGMYVRLAFGVAAHLEPEILIVDEVLAVGDAEFQKKALGKMKAVSEGEGRTVLFVSHNMQAISTLTSKCIILSQGQLVAHEQTPEAISKYLELRREKDLIYTAAPLQNAPSIIRAELVTSMPNNVHGHGAPMELIFDIHAPEGIAGAALAFQLINEYDVPVVHLWLYDTEIGFCRESGVSRVVCKIPRMRAYMGKYTMRLHLAELATGKKLQTIDEVCPFEVVMYGIHRHHAWHPNTCTFIEDCKWEVVKG